MQVTMKLARRSLRMRWMMLERMMVKLHAHMYYYYDYGSGWSIPYSNYDPARSSGSCC
jgi:hypothetical protein